MFGLFGWLAKFIGRRLYKALKDAKLRELASAAVSQVAITYANREMTGGEKREAAKNILSLKAALAGRELKDNILYALIEMAYAGIKEVEEDRPTDEK